MKKIIYTMPNGVVAVVHPVINTYPVPESISEEDALKRALAKLPAGVNAKVVDAGDIPADRTFRDAWQLTAIGISVDMAKAKAIHRERIRAARGPKLAALDVEYQRADEIGDAEAKRSVAQQKNALRDAPADPRIEAAQTPEQLKAAWPECL